MKKALLFLAGLVLVTGFVPRAVVATSPTAMMRQRTEEKTKVLSGTVVKAGDHFILSDAANKLSYILDDNGKVSPYEGKRVKVTGTVDTANNTIHVETIEEIA